ncbi:DNA sulfur modification protein DndD [Janthinobacterium sp. LB2P70]|uniref:DNA sulfur modification protein DndD n=1 Tax=Janthinobacterium sp. LB2P70 TaxID=3424197 RepID=UPI003F2116AD
MWISKLELTCFKSYQHQVFEFPEPENGKNIVLIGGMNGFGKTTILEALYLCLYGKDAIIHLARAGLKSDDKKGYPTFLEGALNGQAKRDGSDVMMVRVTINRTKTKAIDICRKWFFKSNGSGTWTGDEEAVVRDVIRGIPESPRVDGRNGFHFSEMLDEIFVPAHIAPFFFFDGEEVKKLADQSRIEQVKQGLEGLLGVELLRHLADRLKSFEGVKRSEVISVDEDRLAGLSEQLDQCEGQLKKLLQGAEAAESQKNRLRAEQQSLVERITSAGGGGGDIAMVKELVEEREQIRNKLRESHRELEDILSGRLPFHLIPNELTEEYKGQVGAEINWFAWESEKRSLEPRKVEFQSAFGSQLVPVIYPALSEDQNSAIEKRLDAAWEALFYPPPDDCADEIIHSYLHDGQREKSLDFLNSMALGRKEIQEVLSSQYAFQQRADELGRKIARLEGIDRDGTLTALKAELEKIQFDIDALSEKTRSDDRLISSLEYQVNTIRADFMREQGRLDDSSPVRSLIEKSERVRKVLDEVIPALFPLKVKALGRAMTEVYKKLAHKQQVEKIEITQDGNAKILSKTGREIIFDRSAGENQIFATALIAGLAKVSGVKAPMVVDTPLGRLDSEHRNNIVNFWVSDKSRQVILLSQDEEIDYRFHKEIAEYVSVTYLLEHVDVGDGIGRTTAKQGKYFTKGRR